MATYNEVGLAKNELNDIKNALEYQVTNDLALLASTVERYNVISEIIKDMRQQIVDYDTANTTDLDPAAVIRVVVNAF